MCTPPYVLLVNCGGAMLTTTKLLTSSDAMSANRCMLYTNVLASHDPIHPALTVPSELDGTVEVNVTLVDRRTVVTVDAIEIPGRYPVHAPVHAPIDAAYECSNTLLTFPEYKFGSSPVIATACCR